MAARILEGSLDALSLAEGYAVVRRSETQNSISNGGAAAFLARFGSGLGLGGLGLGLGVEWGLRPCTLIPPENASQLVNANGLPSQRFTRPDR